MVSRKFLLANLHLSSSVLEITRTRLGWATNVIVWSKTGIKKLGSSNQGGLLEVVESFFAKRTEESVLVETCVLSFVLLELK